MKSIPDFHTKKVKSFLISLDNLSSKALLHIFWSRTCMLHFWAVQKKWVSESNDI
jgi:hypothetical protein